MYEVLLENGKKVERCSVNKELSTVIFTKVYQTFKKEIRWTNSNEEV